MIALLLAPNRAFSIQPFTWDINNDNRQTIVVPAGMVWVVEQATGFSSDSRGIAPVIAVKRTGVNVNQVFLYLSPSFVAYNPALVGGTSTFYAGYGQSLTARLTGSLRAEAVTTSGFPAGLALSGYLTPSLGGDFNGDSVVNAADYSVFRDQSLYWGPGDYQQWAAGYGSSATSASASMTIPEPSAALLAILGWASLVSRRMR